MRIAVVGATGNTGTALLEELVGREDVTGVLGVARRMPDTSTQPYSQADWVTADVQFPEAEDTLAEAFAEVDAVVHLAWLIQPNSKRELLRRVNVDGTRYVLNAAAAAGVRHIAVASSVAAYSAVDDDDLRDESWPTQGIPGSHYSEDKVAQERVMDEFEAAHPEISLARLRPGLVFQANAGAEIQRYFAGRWAPTQLLSKVRPPVVPMPAGIRAQAVHAKDLAVAYAEAVLRGARGAFNICADDVLAATTIAGAVEGKEGPGRIIPLPLQALRPMIKAANRSHVLPMDEGWLDMAVGVPLMDASRAKAELGWVPSTTGLAALQDIIDGMAAGAGRASVPMRPRTVEAEYAYPLPDKDHRITDDEIDVHLLRQYLADHLSGATAGLQRIRTMADDFVDTPVFPQLSEVAEVIRLDYDYLNELMKRQDFPRPGLQAPLLWAGERASRLKPYGNPFTRTASSLVLETELMLGAVTAKLHGWKVLRDYASALGVAASVFDELVESAEQQRETLGEVHAYARKSGFRKDMDTLVPGK